MIATVTLNPSLDEWVSLPSLRLGMLNRAAQFTRYPGGKGINISRVLHELGGPTVAYAFAGGEDGAILARCLQAFGIQHEFVSVDGLTRNNYKLQTARPRAVTEINTAGPSVKPTAVRQLLYRLLRQRPRPHGIALSGSLPPGLPSTTYARMIRALRRLQIPIALDTAGPALRQGLLARPWLIKPNRREAEELLGRRLRHVRQAANAARRLANRIRTHILISLGAEGAVFASSGRADVLWAKPPRVAVDSPVGAGDSLVAGFVMGWLRTHSLREAFRLGMACGVACAMTPGTELCRREDVERLQGRISIRTI